MQRLKYILAGEARNAYYSRGDRTLKFFYFYHEGKIVYTCRSFDIIAHETGHAILDALRPGYWFNSSNHSQTAGLHESFGDLTAIFTMLSQMDICEAIIAETKLDLYSENFLSSIAEEFGEALFGHSLGLRNAFNDLKLSDVSRDPDNPNKYIYDLSKVFTGAIYDIIVKFFEQHLDIENYDPAETLFRVGQKVLSFLIAGLLNGPEQNATFYDISNEIIKVIEDKEWKKIAKRQFKKREILEAPLGIAPTQPLKRGWNTCKFHFKK